MCRLMAYIGPSVLVADVVLWPARSIIKQSYDARERQNDASLPRHLAHANLNGDGFGIGWFAPDGGERPDPTPCTFTSITPAWNNENLGRLSCKITSPLVFAHVRAAYPGMPVSEQNCHPFQWGRYLWMHNGVVGGFMKIRRAMLALLSNEAYNAVQSFHSDSAVAFAVFLHHLPDMDCLLQPSQLLAAMEATIATISRLQAEAGVTDTSLLNFVLSDGSTLIATRYVSHADAQPASLYYAEGSAFERYADKHAAGEANGVAEPLSPRKGPAAGSSTAGEGEYRLNYGEVGSRVVLVVSEPITGNETDWVAIPPNTALVITREKNGFVNVMRTPLAADGEHPRQDEVARCLEAVSGSAGVTAKPWTLGKRKSGVGGVPHKDRQHDAVSASGSLRAALSKSEAVAKVVTLEEHRLTGHAGAVLCMRVSVDGLLFTGATDGLIKVWDLQSCRCLRTLGGHRSPVQRLDIHAGFLFSAAGRVRVWDLATYACIHIIETSADSGTIGSLCIGDDGTVYVGRQDTRLQAFRLQPANVDGHQQAAQTRSQPDAVTSAADSHCSSVNALALCGELLCSAGGDAMIRVWKSRTLEFVRVLRGHRGSVLTLYAAAGLLLSGGRDNVVRVWDMEAQVCRRTLTGHRDDITSITGIHLGSKASRTPTSPPPAEPSCMLRSSMTQNGVASTSQALDVNGTSVAATVFATASTDRTVRLWSGACWTCLRIFTCPAAAPPTPFLVACMTNAYTITGSPDGVVRLWACEEALRKLQRPCGGTAAERVASAQLSAADSAQSSFDYSEVGGEVLQVTKRQCTEAAATSAPGGGGSGRSGLEKELERTLREFVRLRTVSCDPAHREDCFRGAKFLAYILESLGAEIKIAAPLEDKNPVVIGRLGRDESRPTVTFYGHYDVQPAMERDWKTDPFEMASTDGYFYGRGTSDNKGPILAFIYAVKEMLQAGGGSAGPPPVNIAFVFEGEEENGSRGFQEAVLGNLHWFEGTQLVVISNTLWVGEQVPCLTYGMRGMIALSVEVRGPQRDLHSGNDGGVFAEPLVDLTKVLAHLVDAHNVIQVPGFYEGVRPHMLDAALARLEASQEFSLASYRSALGIPSLLTALSKRELLSARWCSPTLSVVDVRVGDEEDSGDSAYRFGPTRFSVIPRCAVGNVSIRFVPDQDAAKLIASFRVHVESEFAKLGSSNQVSVRVKSVGDWWEADPESKLFRLAERAVAKEWGQTPLFVREGGTMPVASVLEKMLGAPALLVPFGQSSDNCHLANERLQRINLIKGKNIIKHLLQEVATS